MSSSFKACWVLCGQPLRLVDLIGLGFILYHGRSISVSNLVQGHISFILELGP